MNIKKILVGSAAGVLMLGALSSSVFAAGNGTDHFGPFASTTTDGSTCGPDWATDQVNRLFTVHDNGDGTFNVTESFKDGTFVTNGVTSPGACETTNHHGTTVTAGINGNFQGSESGTVTSTTYNPNACTAATCNTTAGFISTVFGPLANFDIATYNFEYNSSDKTLQYHSWSENFNKNSTSEQDTGDIATQ
jgi:hypothetical protein